MSKNKVSYEKKVEIVRDYLDGRVGYTTRPSRQSLAIQFSGDSRKMVPFLQKVWF